MRGSGLDWSTEYHLDDNMSDRLATGCRETTTATAPDERKRVIGRSISVVSGSPGFAIKAKTSRVDSYTRDNE